MNKRVRDASGEPSDDEPIPLSRSKRTKLAKTRLTSPEDDDDGTCSDRGDEDYIGGSDDDYDQDSAYDSDEDRQGTTGGRKRLEDYDLSKDPGNAAKRAKRRAEKLQRIENGDASVPEVAEMELARMVLEEEAILVAWTAFVSTHPPLQKLADRIMDELQLPHVPLPAGFLVEKTTALFWDLATNPFADLAPHISSKALVESSDASRKNRLVSYIRVIEGLAGELLELSEKHVEEHPQDKPKELLLQKALRELDPSTPVYLRYPGASGRDGDSANDRPREDMKVAQAAKKKGVSAGSRLLNWYMAKGNDATIYEIPDLEIGLDDDSLPERPRLRCSLEAAITENFNIGFSRYFNVNQAIGGEYPWDWKTPTYLLDMQATVFAQKHADQPPTNERTAVLEGLRGVRGRIALSMDDVIARANE